MIEPDGVDGARVIDCRRCPPRSPAAPGACNVTGAANVRPPSVDPRCGPNRGVRIACVPRHRYLRRRAGTRRSDTRGAISPLTRASPARALTLTGASKLRPLSRLVATYTSPLPEADAAQTTATNDPDEATDGVALVRPGIASVIASGGAAEVPAVPAWIARTATKSHVPSRYLHNLDDLKPHSGAELDRARLADGGDRPNVAAWVGSDTRRVRQLASSVTTSRRGW